jgi:surfeit locus 1 family protein
VNAAALRSILTATICAVAGVALLLGLGVWQLERKAWKEALIEALTARLAGDPRPLPPRAQWSSLDESQDEFRRVRFRAEFRNGEAALVYTAGSAFRPDVSGPGYWVLSPARLPDGGVVVVNRGFVPADRKDAVAPPPDAAEIVGVLRWPERGGTFTPAPSNGIWYARDQLAIAAAKKWGEGAPSPIAPFYVEQEQPTGGNASNSPRAGKLVVHLTDNHLQYAITWFGLAAALAAVYLLWLRGRLRKSV